jgi:hypothetical protein
MVMLMEPIFAAFMGAAVGVSTLPGWVTWAGDGVVTIGSIMVISSGSKKTESIDATEALHTIEEEYGPDKHELKKSSMLTRSPMLAKNSITMKSPLILKSPANARHPTKQRGKDWVANEEVEFVSVNAKSRAYSMGGDGNHRVVWN